MSDATDNTTQEQDEVKREVKKPKQQQGKAFSPEPVEGEDAGERAEMNRLYDETLRHLEEGEIVRGRVIKITEQEVLVDVGFKSEGAIPIGEFRRDNIPQVGEEIEVFLEEAENADGHLILSKEKADKARSGRRSPRSSTRTARSRATSPTRSRAAWPSTSACAASFPARRSTCAPCAIWAISSARRS